MLLCAQPGSSQALHAAGGGNFSSCPCVHRPVLGSGGARACMGGAEQQSRSTALTAWDRHRCELLWASASAFFLMLAFFSPFFSLFVTGPAQNRIRGSVFITFQIIYTLFLVLTLCMKGYVTAVLMFPCDTEAYWFFSFHN